MRERVIENHPRIAIVGAGISGICMAIRLLRDGFDNITIFEKGDDFGGTWRENKYPGLVCDVPSRFFQFTFAKNAEWSRLYSARDEILNYLNGVARADGVDKYTRFRTEVAAATYDHNAWRVTTTDGTTEDFDFLVCATGFLHHPLTPDLPGLANFRGQVFHSARWDRNVQVAGKRVGVVGTGSTGTQLTTALAGVAEHVTVFQRTAQWILPTKNRSYSLAAKTAYRLLPGLGTLSYRLYQRIFALFSLGLVRPGVVRRVIGWTCARYLRTVRDPELRAKLTPDYPPMCKRLVISDGFYRAIQRPDIDLVTAGIEQVEPAAIKTKDGVQHELDVLIFATGFDAHAYMRPIAITGTDGLTLDQAWNNGPRAFQGLMMPSFPNLFMMMGPHSPLGNHPVTATAEVLSERILWWLRRWSAGEFKTVQPTEAATQRYNDGLREALDGTVWVGGCRSWYLGADGSPDLWPSSPDRFEVMVQRDPNPDDFHLDHKVVGPVETS